VLSLIRARALKPVSPSDWDGFSQTSKTVMANLRNL
jgi:hypothetical protein